MPALRTSDFQLSVVVPCCNEEAVIRATHQRLEETFDESDFEVEILYVNDGSFDDTERILCTLADTDRRVEDNLTCSQLWPSGCDHGRS